MTGVTHDDGYASVAELYDRVTVYRRGSDRVIRSVFVLLGCLVAGCASIPAAPVSAYTVTATPLDVGIGARGFCIAVDPVDSRGVWWWEPEASGCNSRSTGPGVFHAEAAAVSRSTRTGAIDVRFRVPLIRAVASASPRFADVALEIEGARMRAVKTGAEVAAEVRTNLDIPESVR